MIIGRLLSLSVICSWKTYILSNPTKQAAPPYAACQCKSYGTGCSAAVVLCDDPQECKDTLDNYGEFIYIFSIHPEVILPNWIHFDELILHVKLWWKILIWGMFSKFVMPLNFDYTRLETVKETLVSYMWAPIPCYLASFSYSNPNEIEMTTESIPGIQLRTIILNNLLLIKIILISSKSEWTKVKLNATFSWQVAPRYRVA